MRSALIPVLAACLAFTGCGLSDLDVSGSDETALSGSELRGGNTTYNCNRDKKLEVPGSLTAAALSAHRGHFKLTEGSDAAGMGSYSVTFTAPDGTTGSYELRQNSCFGMRTITDAYVDGLRADTAYQVRLQSSDLCGNRVTSEPIAMLTPREVPETTGPRIASFTVSSVGFFGSRIPILLAVTEDDTGMDRVEFWKDGTLLGTSRVKVSGGLWPTETQVYEAPGINFNVWKTPEPGTYEARAFDVFGNRSVVSKQFVAGDGGTP